jgi:hypothetical protein
LVKRRTQIPASWTLTPALRAYAIERGIPAARVDDFAAEFKEYWRADGRVKLDWDMAFQVRVRDQGGRFQARASPSNGREERASAYDFARLGGVDVGGRR